MGLYQIFKKLNLKARMLITIISMVLFAFLATNVFVLVSVNTITKAEAIDKAKESAYHYSTLIEAHLDEAMATARTLARTFEGMKTAQNPDRHAMDMIQKRLMEQNPRFLGIWTCWEPNALDGRDADYANKRGHDETGRYIPYWNRANGAISLEPLRDYEKPGIGNYYLVPKKTGEETVIDPYSYAIGGKDFLLSSFAVPINHNGSFIGVVGIDMVLDMLQQETKKVRPYETGYATLISNNGYYVAHFDSRRVGKKVVEESGTADGLKTMLTTGSSSMILDTDDDIANSQVYRIIVPIHIGLSKAPWGFEIVVPLNKTLEKVNQISNIATIFILIMLAILTLVVLWITNSIANPLKRIIGSLDQGAAQVSSASGQLSATAQQLSQGSAEQAAAIEETSSTLQEATSMLQQSTANTRQATQLSEQAKESADKGNLEMREMMSSMGEIKRSSDQIAKIIKVIDDIAFQTNILALNAAIEAARAGEAGMGFAVVAEEVRNLAQRSAQAAKDTTAIIASNISLSDKGVAAAEKVSQALTEITHQAKRVNELMAEISAASQEQYQGVEQATKAIDQIEIITQQNSANSEETASAAEELNSQAENLKKIVAELFRLVNGNGNSSSFLA